MFSKKIIVIVFKHQKKIIEKVSNFDHHRHCRRQQSSKGQKGWSCHTRQASVTKWVLLYQSTQLRCIVRYNLTINFTALYARLAMWQLCTMSIQDGRNREIDSNSFNSILDDFFMH